MTPNRNAFAAGSLALLLAGCGTGGTDRLEESGGKGARGTNAEVVAHYAKLVHATYEDSLIEAKKLQTALENLSKNPGAETLESAKNQWKAARVPYMQTEVFRFYAGPIDDEDGPEGLLNAWPLDEGYVDYVVENRNSGIINNPADYPEITKALIVELNEKDGEENISAGFHAIEFLLWGQDRSDDGPGNRPFTDYSTAANAERRARFLLAAAGLLVDNLRHLVDEWSPREGTYRSAFESAEPDESVEKILTGMSMLSGFELSGERLLVALETQSQEDEHSCFSDTTLTDVIHDALGIVNVWEGTYSRIDGSKVTGPGVKALAAELDAGIAAKLDASIESAYALSKEIPAPFDQAILGDDEAPGRKAIMALVETLEDQAELIVALSHTMGMEVPTTESEDAS